MSVLVLLSCQLLFLTCLPLLKSQLTPLFLVFSTWCPCWRCGAVSCCSWPASPSSSPYWSPCSLCLVPGAPVGAVELSAAVPDLSSPPQVPTDPPIPYVQYLVPLLALWSCQLLFLTCLPLLKSRLNGLLSWGAGLSLQYYRPEKIQLSSEQLKKILSFDGII
jgi:hypothetical protein